MSFFSLTQALEDRVWELLQEADKTAEENKDQSQVYDAMAQTLGDAWAALVSMLERRRELLRLTSEFFDYALEVCILKTFFISKQIKNIPENVLFLKVNFAINLKSGYNNC